jgi:hypothetical protein
MVIPEDCSSNINNIGDVFRWPELKTAKEDRTTSDSIQCLEVELGYFFLG